MTNKALISDLTWRSLEMQRQAFPDMPHYIAPAETAMLLRPTSRTQHLCIHVISFAVIANNADDFTSFLKSMPGNAKLISKEEAWTIGSRYPIKKAIAMFRSARKFGAAKVGARARAEKKKAATILAVEKIRDRWPLPSKDHPTATLLEEAGISLNTAKSILGKRPIAQYNHQAKLKRAAKRNAA